MSSCHGYFRQTAVSGRTGGGEKGPFYPPLCGHIEKSYVNSEIREISAFARCTHLINENLVCDTHEALKLKKTDFVEGKYREISNLYILTR